MKKSPAPPLAMAQPPAAVHLLLRHCRERCGYSTARLAELAGMPAERYAALEEAGAALSPAEADALARLLAVPALYLLLYTTQLQLLQAGHMLIAAQAALLAAPPAAGP